MPDKIDVFALPVFSAADVFPMLLPEDLAELADDIKVNGLREPLVITEVSSDVVDDDGVVVETVVETVLVDGRNRREACRMAKVKPTTRSLNGEDPTAFVISANIHRRHMGKSSRAMALAMVYPEPKRGRGNKDPAKGAENVSFTLIKQARLVVRYTPEHCQAVLQGESLDKAYEKAKLKRDEDQSEAEKQDEADAARKTRIDALGTGYPELAVKVEEGEFSLEAMEEQARGLDVIAENQREVFLVNIDNVRLALLSFSSESFNETAQKHLDLDVEFFRSSVRAKCQDYTDEFREKLTVGFSALLDMMENEKEKGE